MSTVKLEVGAWYIGKWSELAYEVQPDRVFVHASSRPYTHEYFSEGIENGTMMVSGPYHIEPGDRVKPKPAGDKCWDTEWDCLKWKDDIEGIVGHIRDCTVSGMPTAFFDGKRENLPLSCLILLEKAAKAPAQNFQVGDEVEVLPIGHECWKDVGCKGDGSDPHICHDRDKGVLPIKEDWMYGCRYKLIKSCLPAKCLKLIRRAGEKQVHRCPGCGCVEGDLHATKDCPVFLEQKENQAEWDAAKKRIRDETLAEFPKTKLPLNPRVLPSVSGSELLWPDVKHGIELDTLPMDCMTKLDHQCMEDANCEMKDMERIHEILCDFDIQFMSNSDRERIRKIIPEIRQKLATLEREVQK